MASIEIENDFFQCRQENDCALITTKEGAKGIFTTVGLKEEMIATLKAIEDLPDIKGIALIYSSQYQGDAEYKLFFQKVLEDRSVDGQDRASMRFRTAVIQFYKIIIKYPKPIVVGMNGNIGPDSLGLSLVCDVRIATEKANFMNPNIHMGFPPSALLSFFLVQSLGSVRATELMLTKTKFSPHEALDLGLITQLASEEDIENTCIGKLKELSELPSHAIIETRNLFHSDVSVIEKHLDKFSKSSIRSLYKMQS